MATLSKMILVNAPVELIWSYVENPLQVVAMSDFIRDVSNLEPSPVGGYNCTMTYDFGAQSLKVPFRTTEYVRNQRLVTRVTQGLESVQTWTMQQTGTVTTVNLDVEYHYDLPLLGRLAENVAARRGETDIEKMLHRLKDVCESLAAQRQTGQT